MKLSLLPNFGACYYEKGMSSISHVLSIQWVFLHFFCATGNWWENSCISCVMKYTIGQEFNMRKVTILWEKYEYQFPRFSSYDGFYCIFPCYGKMMGKPMHLFPLWWDSLVFSCAFFLSSCFQLKSKYTLKVQLTSHVNVIRPLFRFILAKISKLIWDIQLFKDFSLEKEII